MAYVIDSADLLKAKALLQNGDVVAIPTETVYGLAASIESEKALKKVFELKSRPFFDPLIVHVASFEQARSVTAYFPPVADFLARWFWPGPLTLVLPKAAHLSSLITSGLETVAVRYPAHPLAIELIKMVGSPLAAPSANRFGKTSPSTAAHVRTEFPEANLLIVDGGPCQVGLESTVISFFAPESPNGEAEVRILRPGGVTEEALCLSLKRWGHPVRVVRADSSESPGHLKHHYMPTVPLIIAKEKPSIELLARIAHDLKTKPAMNPRELVLSDDATVAARRLYGEMRALCEDGADLLYVIETSDRTGGLWTAVWDRLTRAASWTLIDQSRLEP